MIDYPYMLSNNKIPQIILGISAAAKPAKLTIEFLRNMGFTSTNDRAIVPLFKKLGFLSDDGVPTVFYDQLRDQTNSKKILASKIKELYNELFTINVKIYNDTEANIKGAISRVTGKDETGVIRIYNTFKALCSIADFSCVIEPETVEKSTKMSEEKLDKSQILQVNRPASQFHYNIQIHLPATTDISVYNAIFKSLKDNLII